MLTRAIRRSVRGGATRAASSTLHADCLVVGAGPAGISAVGWLLAAKRSVVWVDGGNFDGGKLAAYRDVPANTKVDVLAQMGGHDFLPFGLPKQAMEKLRHMHETATPLQGITPPDPANVGWTGLDQCHDFYRELARAFLDGSARGYNGSLQAIAGRCLEIRKAGEAGGAGGQWRARIHIAGGSSEELLSASSVVLATGAPPINPPVGMLPSAWAAPSARATRVLPVEDVLALQRLKELVSPGETVAVVGGGHTGLVATMLLSEQIRCTTKLFIRRPLRLAEWDAASGAYGRWAFRGLKGAAASFAHRHGMVGVPPPNGPVANAHGLSLELHDAASLTACPRAGHGLDAVTFCLGFGGPALPQIVDAAGRPVVPDAQRLGRLLDARGEWIRGLYGVGLAFADQELSSGVPYAEAGFMPFALRGREIVESLLLEAAAHAG